MSNVQIATDHLDTAIKWVEALLAHARADETQRTDLERRIIDVAHAMESALASAEDLPWNKLRIRLSLTPSEQITLLILSVLELVPSIRKRSVEGTWPDVGLLAGLVYSKPSLRARMLTELGAAGTLLRQRLVEVVGSPRQVDDAPFMLRPLRVAPRVLEGIHGIWRLDPEVEAVGEIFTARDLVGAERQVEEVRSVLASGASVAIVHGPEGSGRKSVIAAAAREIGRSVLLVRCAELPSERRELARIVEIVLREAQLFETVPAFEELDRLDDDGVRTIDRATRGFPGSIAATMRHATHATQFSRGVVLVELASPAEHDRATLWKAALGDAPPDLCNAAAARYSITAGVIRRSANALARPNLNDQDIHRAVRDVLDATLAGLGVRVETAASWNDLVLPDETYDDVKEMVARVQHRKLVHDEWGFADKIGRGISALFYGPPGTGKTMVAGLVAKALQLDLYQIDLSRIVSKWIGETEKNLARIFDAAESGHAILLFDEADSLFAKRTEVKSSVDRYANLEVNYLLQRMERFSGISILTTNLDASIDEAFRRRLSARINFPLPELAERERLWRALTPRKAAVRGDVDLRELARRYEMSGGYIRNAIVRAAYLAASEGNSIGMTHLTRAATLEYAAMGKVMHGGLH